MMTKNLVFLGIFLVLASLTFISAQSGTLSLKEGQNVDLPDGTNVEAGAFTPEGTTLFFESPDGEQKKMKLLKEEKKEFSIAGILYSVKMVNRYLFFGKRVKIEYELGVPEEEMPAGEEECVIDDDCLGLYGEGFFCSEGFCAEEGIVGAAEEITTETECASDDECFNLYGEGYACSDGFCAGAALGEGFAEGEFAGDFWGGEFEEWGGEECFTSDDCLTLYGEGFGCSEEGLCVEEGVGEFGGGEFAGEEECIIDDDCLGLYGEGFFCSEGFCAEEVGLGEEGFGDEFAGGGELAGEGEFYREGDVIELENGVIEIVKITNTKVTFTITSDGVEGTFSAGTGENVLTNVGAIQIGEISGGGLFGGRTVEIFISSAEEAAGLSSEDVAINAISALSGQNQFYNGFSPLQRSFLIKTLPGSCFAPTEGETEEGTGTEISGEGSTETEGTGTGGTETSGGTLSGGSLGGIQVGSLGGGGLRIFLPISGLVVSSGSSCSDTDGGKNALSFGVAGDRSSCLQDSCADEATVSEAFCRGGSVSTEEKSCPAWASCYQGVCVSKKILPALQKSTTELTPVQGGTLTPSSGGISVSGGGLPVLGGSSGGSFSLR